MLLLWGTIHGYGLRQVLPLAVQPWILILDQDDFLLLVQPGVELRLLSRQFYFGGAWDWGEWTGSRKSPQIKDFLRASRAGSWH